MFFLRVILLFCTVTLALYNTFWGPHLPVLYALAGAAFLFTMWFFNGRDGRFAPMYNAHWADRQEIKDMFVSAPTGYEIYLGYAYGKPVALKAGLAGKKEMGHVLIVGPTRSGKGLNAMANLENFRGSIVAVDIKGEFYKNTAGYRHDELGQDVFVLNPSSGALTNHFDPFAERDTDEQLLATASAILNPSADGSNQAFGLRATFALFAITKTAKLLTKPVLPFVRDCLAMGIESCMKMLYQSTNDPAVHRNVNYFLGTSPDLYDWEGVQGDKFLNNSWMNLVSKMTYLLSDGVVEMTSSSDFKAVDLLKKPTSLYMVFRESDLKYTVHSFSAVILSIIESIIKHYDLHPDEPTVPIMFIFDEAGRITVPELPNLTSTVAGRGMIALIYVQALAQLETAYERTGADTIKANTHTKIYFTPKDADTARYISENSGKFMVEDQRHNVGESESDSTGLSSRELITVDQVQEMPGGRVIIKCNEFPYIAAYRMEPFTLPQDERARKLKPPPLRPRLAKPDRPRQPQKPAATTVPAPVPATAPASATLPATSLAGTSKLPVTNQQVTVQASVSPASEPSTQSLTEFSWTPQPHDPQSGEVSQEEKDAYIARFSLDALAVSAEPSTARPKLNVVQDVDD